MRYWVLSYFLLLPLILYRDELSLHAYSGVWQHFLFPFAHANLLHWLINGITLMSISWIVRLPRTIWAYIFSVVCGYIYQPDLPLLGMSTIIYFYLGMLFVHIPRSRKLHILILSVVGLFIPSIAAVTHIIMLVFGILSEFLRLNWIRYDYR